jgi:hypothetical protein
MLVLAVQHLAVFWGHYFKGVGIPWDFAMSYYAMVSFWTNAVSQGIFPQWIPFQQMGYPFALQLQSGMNYLPLWMFPLLKIPYTLHAAIVFQCLHVLLGSIGMFMLARQVHGSSRYALIAAVSFQFFGGFYSNAEHVDIVRAFAYAPWILYVFTLDVSDRPHVPYRALLIPLVLYLLVTGGYPGNVLASGFIIALYVCLQLIDGHLGAIAPRRLIALAAAVAGLTVLGCGMAILQIGPVWLYRDQFTRAEQLGSLARESLGVEHLPGLFLSNRRLPGEISMTSTYVTLPMLFFATFTPARALKRYWVYLCLGGFALLMTAGSRLPVSEVVTTLIPVLRLSRFPSSDYRVFVAIPLILLSLAGLRAIVDKELSGQAIALRSAFCVAWLLWGLAHVYSFGREIGVTTAVAAASLLVVFLLWRRPARLTVVGLAGVVLLISLDALRVLPDMPGWYQTDIDAYYSRMRWPPYRAGGRLVASRIFRNIPTSRPSRTVPAGLVRWNGYLDGRYVTTDLTPNVLPAARAVRSNTLYQRYMLMEWSPLLLDARQAERGTPHLAVPESEIADSLGNAKPIGAGTVKQTRYGVNDIVYQVSLSQPRLLVENEMYFPGWQARLSTPDARTIQSIAVNGVFRSWLLPQGDYTMEAHFVFPYLLGLRLVALASLLLWLSVVLVRWTGARRSYKALPAS